MSDEEIKREINRITFEWLESLAVVAHAKRKLSARMTTARGHFRELPDWVIEKRRIENAASKTQAQTENNR